MRLRRIAALLLAALMLLSATACSKNPAVSDSDASVVVVPQFPADQYEYKYQWYATLTPEEIVSTLTLDQKASQIVQPLLYMLMGDGSLPEGEDKPIESHCYGSIYADEGMQTAEQWREILDGLQQQAIESEAGIPLLIAEDDAHGVGYCIDGVYFPHNIGQGAANDEELAYKVGLITADEAKLCHMPWNLYPCVAQSTDPRWGRTYECYSSDLDTIKRLSTSYTKGLIDGGVIATAKHYFGDGNTGYATGENTPVAPRLFDRGDAQLSDAEIAELLAVYQAQIDAGVQVIMVSYSSLNGTKMHENAEYIRKLRDEMGFEGVIMTDSMAVESTTPLTYKEQVVSALNCGIDVLMEGQRYDEARQAIIDGVADGTLSEERLDDAVTRFIKLKKDSGIMADPFLENVEAVKDETGSDEYRAVAEKLVEESLVLLKNENNTLPLKEGEKVYITGPVANNSVAQCGGWTMGWTKSYTSTIKGVTTIREAFEKYAKAYGITVLIDEADAKKADVVLLCVGEDAYAEWYGDVELPALYENGEENKTAILKTQTRGFASNKRVIEEAAALGKPTVVCLVAGRNLILDEADATNWDSIVMCYLPGSEGKGVSDVLCGCADFTGRLPSPWYASVDQIGTNECAFERGYGLSYPEDFVPREINADSVDE